LPTACLDEMIDKARSVTSGSKPSGKNAARLVAV
jgi:hypothetical protein